MTPHLPPTPQSHNHTQKHAVPQLWCIRLSQKSNSREVHLFCLKASEWFCRHNLCTHTHTHTHIHSQKHSVSCNVHLEQSVRCEHKCSVRCAPPITPDLTWATNVSTLQLVIGMLLGKAGIETHSPHIHRSLASHASALYHCFPVSCTHMHTHMHTRARTYAHTYHDFFLKGFDLLFFQLCLLNKHLLLCLRLQETPLQLVYLRPSTQGDVSGQDEQHTYSTLGSNLSLHVCVCACVCVCGILGHTRCL